MNINKILEHDNWKFACLICTKEFWVQIFEGETTKGDTFRDVKEGTLFIHDEDYSYYCEECEQLIIHN